MSDRMWRIGAGIVFALFATALFPGFGPLFVMALLIGAVYPGDPS